MNLLRLKNHQRVLKMHLTHSAVECLQNVLTQNKLHCPKGCNNVFCVCFSRCPFLFDLRSSSCQAIASVWKVVLMNPKQVIWTQERHSVTAALTTTVILPSAWIWSLWLVCQLFVSKTGLGDDGGDVSCFSPRLDNVTMVMMSDISLQEWTVWRWRWCQCERLWQSPLPHRMKWCPLLHRSSFACLFSSQHLASCNQSINKSI